MDCLETASIQGTIWKSQEIGNGSPFYFHVMNREFETPPLIPCVHSYEGQFCAALLEDGDVAGHLEHWHGDLLLHDDDDESPGQVGDWGFP